ncbi:MAG: hypothetical protein CFE37_04900 [Alphaproteobacteria bacterium PA4]|nr:MAG: hypothetical protein CFE37_04900 [Alphaproteobacteria bacterium PA4]
MPSAAQFHNGPLVEPIKMLWLYSPEDWEGFIDEWVSECRKNQYVSVVRTTGANDRGIDIAAFADSRQLAGVWDNYQCKRFRSSISAAAAWPEIGKILWHSFNGHYVAPRRYFFVAPKGAGTQLNLLLANTPNLKAELIKVWDKSVASKITSTKIDLTGNFAAYVEKFDFSIFRAITPRELIGEHRKTPFFISRFGGGLPARPMPDDPPEDIHPDESVYVGALFDAYADHTKEAVTDIKGLKNWKTLHDHFGRQREAFYHAESFRVFVRDKVEPGSFESLQDEVYRGVVDACDSAHVDGFERVKAVLAGASILPLDSHPLGSSAFMRDRHGMCHQLANEERLTWKK